MMGRSFHKTYILDNLDTIENFKIYKTLTNTRKERYRLEFSDLTDYSLVSEIEQTLNELNYQIESIDVRPNDMTKDVIVKVYP